MAAAKVKIILVTSFVLEEKIKLFSKGFINDEENFIVLPGLGNKETHTVQRFPANFDFMI
jgi:hypothetical protein